MRFIIAQGHGQRIFWSQGDGGGVSGADRAHAAALGVHRDAPGRRGDHGGGVRVAHGDGQHRVAALGVRRAQGAFRDAVRGRRAERDIRMAKVRQKVSGCFRTLRHAEAHCRISSYLQSMAYQGYNPLTAIQIALNGTAATMIEQEKGVSSYNKSCSRSLSVETLECGSRADNFVMLARRGSR